MNDTDSYNNLEPFVEIEDYNEAPQNCLIEDTNKISLKKSSKKSNLTSILNLISIGVNLF